MSVKTIVKVSLDIGMTIILLFLMAYEMIGQIAHEWLGNGIFVLFAAPHILNRKWGGSLLGKILI